MIACPNCGSPVVESQKFCSNCGSSIPIIDTNNGWNGDDARNYGFINGKAGGGFSQNTAPVTMTRRNFYKEYAPKSVKVGVIFATVIIFIRMILLVVVGLYLSWLNFVPLLFDIPCTVVMLTKREWRAPAIAAVLYFIWNLTIGYLNGGISILGLFAVFHLMAALWLFRVDKSYQNYLRTGTVE